MFRFDKPVAGMALAAAGTLAACVAAAAGDPVLDVIVVTPVPGQVLQRDLLPANVQVADSAAIDSSHVSDASDFLNRYLGSVNINQTQNNPFQPDLTFRGFTASPLLGAAQGLSVYLDGVRLNQPFGDVVSWDLIPRRAIDNMVLMPGSNPLFGLNTLGGALNVATKSGNTDPGTLVEVLGGEYGRRSVEFEHGAGDSDGWHWYVTGNRFHDDGWRMVSSSDVRQLFGKAGVATAQGSVDVSVAWAHNDLFGNGLQEMRLLEADRRSIYTLPDITRNHSLLVNVAATRELGDDWKLAGNAYYRKIRTATLNGDLNDDSLDQATYQPSAAERAALTAAGFSGFPQAGESAANTPFPKWRCIAQTLLKDEPGEKCNGIVNTSGSDQQEAGFGLQVSRQQRLGGLDNLLVIGAAYDSSSVDFHQEAELGYLNADRSITTTGAVADGVHAGNIDDMPYDARVLLAADTATASVFITDTLAITDAAHITFSGRYNRTHIDNRDALHPAGGTGSLNGDYTFSRFNPALGLTWDFGHRISAYAGANQGSRAPSAIELGCADPATPCKLPNAMAGDPPLNQVVATTLEAGLRGNGEVRWNIGVFRTNSRDDILFVADNVAGFGYFRNFGSTRREGIELGFSTHVAGITLGGNYSYTDATYRSAELLYGSSNSSNSQASAGFPGTEGTIAIVSGDRIPLIPREVLKLFAEVPVTDQLRFNADVMVVGDSFARGNENNSHQPDGKYFLGEGHIHGYAVMNLGAEWQLVPALDVFVQVNNVFDHDYFTSAQLAATGLTASGTYLSRPFPAYANGERPLIHSTFYSPGAPRTSWLGVRYRFGK